LLVEERLSSWDRIGWCWKRGELLKWASSIKIKLSSKTSMTFFPFSSHCPLYIPNTTSLKKFGVQVQAPLTQGEKGNLW